MNTRVRRLLCVALCASSAGWPAQAAPTVPAWPSPAWAWGMEQVFELGAVRLGERAFQARSPLAASVRHLVEQGRPRFDRMLILPGAILLSGLHAGAHWLAWLQAAGPDTHGRVSALWMPAAQAARPLGDAHAAPAGRGVVHGGRAAQGVFPAALPGIPAGLLPPGARPLLQWRQQEAGAQVSLSVHRVGLDAARLLQRQARVLERGGWRGDEAGPGQGTWARTWQRAGMQLRIYTLAGPDGSVVWVWQRGPGP